VRFSRTRRGLVSARLDAAEAAVLSRCAEEMLELLGDTDAVPDDPIAAMVGLPSGEVSTPDDPALARLLPDAYGDDPDAANDFRRYTEADLRAGKRSAASTVLAQLSPLLSTGGKLVVDRDEADAWLTCLNDIRLVLGTRLDVTEEMDDVDPDDPLLAIYGWLGWVQESLISCLEPRSVT
jgi:hypothetical protein